MRRDAKLFLSAALCMALAACASKPKPEPALTPAPAEPAAEAPAAQAAPEPAPVGIRPGSQEDLAANAGERVFFAFDSHDLDAEARQILAQQAAWLARHPDVRVLIAGNADERGTREYNLALGARRANAARQALIAAGVSAGRIQTVSYGKERPVDPASSEEAWAKNRNAHTVVMDAVGRDWSAR